VRSMLAAEAAEFTQLKLVLMLLLIFGRGVISIFTNRAFQGNNFAHGVTFLRV